jgi:signal transduction histidine kinase
MSTNPVHVLLVEDDDVDIMAVKRAFSASKVDNPVLVARDGVEALAMLRGEGGPAVPRPYMILLDLNMPRMGGLEFLRELRSDPEHGRAIVFVLTTSAAKEDRAAAYSEFVAGYMVKANVGQDFSRMVKLLDAYWMILDSNEELRSMNETLQLAKRGLQATNEELRAANAQITGQNIEATRLQEELQRMTFAAAVAGERERRRIAADLHDGIGQTLALAQIKLESMCETISGAPRKAIAEVIDLIAKSIADTRTLTFELSPPVLYDLGLKAALAWLAEDMKKRNGMKIELRDDGVPKPLDDVTASLVFRAVRELLMNVFKHAKAISTKISLRRSGDLLEIEVEDNGIGFDTHDPFLQSAGKGFGLFRLREQINRLGGVVEVVSRPLRGTRVNLRLPLRNGETSQVERSS